MSMQVEKVTRKSFLAFRVQNKQKEGDETDLVVCFADEIGRAHGIVVRC